MHVEIMAGYRRLFLPTNSNLFNSRIILANFCSSATIKDRKNVRNDLSKPKRPQSVFLKYLQQIRPQVLQQNPTWKNVSIVQYAAKEWAKLGVERKRQYQEEYEKEYQIYVQQLKEYEMCVGDDIKVLRKEKSEKKMIAMRKKELENLGKPKKPLSAFFLFLNSERDKKDPEIKSADWLKVMGKKWKDMNTTEKEKFSTEVNVLKKQYDEQMQKWMKKMFADGNYSAIPDKILIEFRKKKENIE